MQQEKHIVDVKNGLPRSGKNQGKTKTFHARSGKIFCIDKVSEKSGNFIFSVNSSRDFAHKIPKKAQRDRRQREKILMAFKKS